jgi:2,3-bisphosphoglycerate-dependent phosphoglycerate mutase
MSAQAAQQPYSMPSRATSLVLVRHGSAAVAPEGGEPLGILDGHNDPPLAPGGLEQAEKVGARLAAEPADRIFVTSLRRTQETAAPLLAALGVEATVIPELREVHLGEWDHQFPHLMRSGNPIAAQVEAEQRWDVIPGGEDTEVFRARVAAGLTQIVEETGPGATAVAFLHGGVIAEICRIATDCRPLTFLLCENTSLTRLALLGGERWLMRSYNDTAHLDG